MRAWTQSNSSTLKTISWAFGAKSLWCALFSSPEVTEFLRWSDRFLRLTVTPRSKHSLLTLSSLCEHVSLGDRHCAELPSLHFLLESTSSSSGKNVDILGDTLMTSHTLTHSTVWPHLASPLQLLLQRASLFPLLLITSTGAEHQHKRVWLFFFTSSNCCWFVFCRRVTRREFSNLSSYRVKDFGRGGQI